MGEAPPCTPVLLTECRRRSPPSLPPPSRSRSSLLPRGNTPSGSEDPSWLLSPPSSRCGSPSRNMTSLAPALSTGNASKFVWTGFVLEQLFLELLAEIRTWYYILFVLVFNYYKCSVHLRMNFIVYF